MGGRKLFTNQYKKSEILFLATYNQIEFYSNRILHFKGSIPKNFKIFQRLVWVTFNFPVEKCLCLPYITFQEHKNLFFQFWGVQSQFKKFQSFFKASRKIQHLIL